jgi:uncharacterized delta-60 repeat protein
MVPPSGTSMAIPASSAGGDFGAAPDNRVGGGRYLLKRLVGRGDFSEVWLARDVKNVRDLALKFLPRTFLPDKNLLEHFQQEVNRNKLLKHPHIIAASELVLDYDTASIAMEFVDGWSLATMKVDKLTHCYNVAEIEPWVRELCEALAYAHKEFGLVHGDLKPSNLLVSTRDGIKVSDFGFGALLRSEGSKRGIVKSSNGGMGFLSPQQVMGGTPSKLDDVYSLGATIYDLLTGTPPFYKGEVIAQICSLKPVRMAQRLAELEVQSDPISPVWEDTVAACLAKNPADRPQSVDEVLQLLGRKELPAQAAPPVIEKAKTATQEIIPPVETTKVPPTLEQAPVSQTNSKLIALAFAGVMALFLIAILAVAVVWFAKKGHFASNAASPPTGGLLDKSFNPGTGADNFIRCLALQPDGKILIGGIFTNFNGVACPKLARLNTNGTLDTTFTPQLEGNVYALALAPDGKILIGGQGLRHGRPARKFTRVEPDGSRDAQFRGEGTYNENVRAITGSPDGSVLVGGDFTRVSARDHHGLLRLSPDDRIDGSFNVSSDGSSTVIATVIQPDGKILEAGVFNNYDNLGLTHLIRLNPDGGFDSGFNAAAYADSNIRALLLQKDGKILACGFTLDTNGAPSSFITRLNPDGNPDAGFHFAAIPGDALWSMAIQSDGKILAGGYNDTNKQVTPLLARLNADGTMDKSFQVTNAMGGCIWSIAVQPDGKIIAAGALTGVDGATCGYIVRLQN